MKYERGVQLVQRATRARCVVRNDGRRVQGKTHVQEYEVVFYATGNIVWWTEADLDRQMRPYWVQTGDDFSDMGINVFEVRNLAADTAEIHYRTGNVRTADLVKLVGFKFLDFEHAKER